MTNRNDKRSQPQVKVFIILPFELGKTFVNQLVLVFFTEVEYTSLGVGQPQKWNFQDTAGVNMEWSSKHAKECRLSSKENL